MDFFLEGLIPSDYLGGQPQSINFEIFVRRFRTGDIWGINDAAVFLPVPSGSNPRNGVIVHQSRVVAAKVDSEDSTVPYGVVVSDIPFVAWTGTQSVTRNGWSPVAERLDAMTFSLERISDTSTRNVAVFKIVGTEELLQLRSLFLLESGDFEWIIGWEYNGMTAFSAKVWAMAKNMVSKWEKWTNLAEWTNVLYASSHNPRHEGLPHPYVDLDMYTAFVTCALFGVATPPPRSQRAKKDPPRVQAACDNPDTGPLLSRATHLSIATKCALMLLFGGVASPDEGDPSKGDIVVLPKGALSTYFAINDGVFTDPEIQRRLIESAAAITTWMNDFIWSHLQTTDTDTTVGDDMGASLPW